jgi:glycosyltransferase involved in cell wall biosynthesis
MLICHSQKIGALKKSERRPRLLFLAHSFPPASKSGSVRTWNIAKYLPRLGWDVTVVTPHPSLLREIDHPEEVEVILQREGIQRILTNHGWRCLVPDRLAGWDRGLSRYIGGICRRTARLLDIDLGVGWIKSVERACATIPPNGVDVILASGRPVIAFRIAQRLAKKFGCPYVLDYRDPWTCSNPHAIHSISPATVREEARLVDGCGAVTIVSPSWGAAMDCRFGVGPKLHVVTNGYDPEEFAEVQPYEFGHPAIVYAGMFYPPKRVISPIMAALQRLKTMPNESENEWFFHYYGDQGDHVRDEAKRYSVEQFVIVHGQVPRAEVLSAVRGARISLVITSISEEDGLAERGIVPGKLFENLGLGTPILLIAPPHSDVGVILASTGGGRRFSGRDIDGIASFLWESIHGQAPQSKDRKAYTWANIASKLDLILRKAMIERAERHIQEEPKCSHALQTETNT